MRTITTGIVAHIALTRVQAPFHPIVGSTTGEVHVNDATQHPHNQVRIPVSQSRSPLVIVITAFRRVVTLGPASGFKTGTPP